MREHPFFQARPHLGQVAKEGAWEEAWSFAQGAVPAEAELSSYLGGTEEVAFEAFFGDFPDPALKRVPKPYAEDHSFADDLRRRDFRAYRKLRVGLASSADFLDEVEATYMAAAPLMEFLCEVIGIPWRPEEA